MVSCGPELTGISLSVLGWVLSVISCALPMWGVYNNKYGYRDPRVEWWGLWMRCEFWSTAQMKCYFSQFFDYPHLHRDGNVIRALSVVSIIAGAVGLLILMVRAKCINCIQNERVKARLMTFSGGVFITSAVVQLVPVFWLICIIPWYYSQSRLKTGLALHLGWAASILMLVGGSILCCICPPQEDKPRKYNIHGQSYVEYSATPRSTAQSSDKKRDEV